MQTTRDIILDYLGDNKKKLVPRNELVFRVMCVRDTPKQTQTSTQAYSMHVTKALKQLMRENKVVVIYGGLNKTTMVRLTK